MLSRTFTRCFTMLVVASCLPLPAYADSSSVKWRTDLDAAMIEAAQSKRLLLLHFWTTKCGPCVVLEQNVFNQPHVGPAIEQEYVPVKIDADAKPALASQFRIDRVPTEIVMTPQGNVVATLSSPNQPDAYLAQLQNLARHFRQTTGPTAGGAPQANVNPAYSNLPVSPALPRQQYNEYVQGATVAAANGGGAVLPPSEAQANQTSTPNASANAESRYGTAASVYAPQTPATSQSQPPAQAQQSLTPSPNLAASSTTMPANAMPRSFRNTATADGATTPAAAAAVGAVAGSVPVQSGQGAFSSLGGLAPTHAAVAGAIAANAASTANPNSSQPQPSGQAGLPADAPPVAFDGCCPVTLKTAKKWTAGNPAVGIVHRGRTYLFVGEAERNQFWADPDGYSPVFAGLDPVLLLESQQSVEGTRQYGYEYGGLFYLFSSKATMDRFASSPNTYAAGVRQAMNKIDASGADVLRR